MRQDEAMNERRRGCDSAWWVGVLAVGMAALTGCGSSDIDAEAGQRAPTTEAPPVTSASPSEVGTDDPRLVGSVEVVDIDLDGLSAAAEVAAVLDWMAGGADDSDCNYFFRGFEGIEVGPGVGVLGDPTAATEANPVASVGESLFVCVAAQDAAVRLVAPSGNTVEFPTDDDGSTTSDGFQVLRTSESSTSDDGTNEVMDDDDFAAEYEVRSFPGAELGEYSLVVEQDGGGSETYDVVFDSQEATAAPDPDPLISRGKIFDFERYRFGFANPLAEAGTLAKFGLVGFPAETDVALAIYRSRDEFEDAPPEQGGYLDPRDFELSDLVTVRTDERGEAVLVFPLADEVRGRCVVVIEAEEANALAEAWQEAPNAYASGYGLDPRMLCVAD